MKVSGTVTMLFTDIEESTGLVDRLGDRYPQLLAEHYRVLREAIEATGGYEVSTTGDSLFAAFTHPRAALDCALRAQRSLGAACWPEGESVRVRMGIHCGAPVVQDGTYVGIDVHCAARVMALAHGGQVLLTQAALDAVGSTVEVLDLGHHRLKDLPAPVHLFQAVAVDLPGEFAPLRSLSNSNLPVALQGLIGRSSEVSTALRLLERSDVRSLTMLGPGGVGKTRLGLEVAAEAVTRYRDGAWFVSLAPLADASLIASEIAQTIGVREAEGRALELTLGDVLARRELLLVLDNFEHLLAGAELVNRLLEAAPGLDVLVTSREVLHLRGEHRMPVAPLAPPDAAELFIQRARAVRPDAIGELDDREAVERICLRLDGLPLALELAAAHVALFNVPALEARLAERLDLPQGPRDLPERQRTLQAAIDWSYQLLSPGEQALFRGFASFAGGARLDAIETIHDDREVEPVQTVAALIDKSLLRRRDDPDGQPRFWMLETIREYASECAIKRNEADAIADRHAAYFLDLAEEAWRHFHTRNQSTWLTRLEADHDNLRAAFNWLVIRAPSRAVRLASTLGDFWEMHGHLTEGREQLRRALARAPGGGATVAKACFLAGRFAFFQGDGEQAEPLFAEALRLARETGDIQVEILALTHIGMVAQALGEATRSIELNEKALAIARKGNDDWILSVALNNLGDTLHTLGETARARPLLEEALEVSRRLAEPMGIVQTSLNLADLELARGDLDAADSLIADGLHRAREIEYSSVIGGALALDALLALHRGELDTAAARIAQSLESLRTTYIVFQALMLLAAAGTLAAAQGDAVRAAQLWAACDRTMLSLGTEDFGGVKRLRDEWLPKVCDAVGATAWQAAWDAGAKLHPNEALDLVESKGPIALR